MYRFAKKSSSKSARVIKNEFLACGAKITLFIATFQELCKELRSYGLAWARDSPLLFFIDSIVQLIIVVNSSAKYSPPNQKQSVLAINA